MAYGAFNGKEIKPGTAYQYIIDDASEQQMCTDVAQTIIRPPSVVIHQSLSTAGHENIACGYLTILPSPLPTPVTEQMPHLPPEVIPLPSPPAQFADFIDPEMKSSTAFGQSFTEMDCLPASKECKVYSPPSQDNYNWPPITSTDGSSGFNVQSVDNSSDHANDKFSSLSYPCSQIEYSRGENYISKTQTTSYEQSREAAPVADIVGSSACVLVSNVAAVNDDNKVAGCESDVISLHVDSAATQASNLCSQCQQTLPADFCNLNDPIPPPLLFDDNSAQSVDGQQTTGKESSGNSWSTFKPNSAAAATSDGEKNCSDSVSHFSGLNNEYIVTTPMQPLADNSRQLVPADAAAPVHPPVNCATVLPMARRHLLDSWELQTKSEPSTPAPNRRRPNQAPPPPPPPCRTVSNDNSAQDQLLLQQQQQQLQQQLVYEMRTKTLPRNFKNEYAAAAAAYRGHVSSTAPCTELVRQLLQNHATASAANSRRESLATFNKTSPPPAEDGGASSQCDRISLCQPPRNSFSSATATLNRHRTARSSAAKDWQNSGVGSGPCSSSGLDSAAVLMSSMSVSSLPAAVMYADVEPKKVTNAPSPPRRGSSMPPAELKRQSSENSDGSSPLRRGFSDRRSKKSSGSSDAPAFGSTFGRASVSNLFRENDDDDDGRGMELSNYGNFATLIRHRGNSGGDRTPFLSDAISLNHGGKKTGNKLKTKASSRSVMDLSNWDDFATQQPSSSVASKPQPQPVPPPSTTSSSATTAERPCFTTPSAPHQKPIAQIRPNAIRTPTVASTYIGTRYGIRPSLPAFNSNNQQAAGTSCNRMPTYQIPGTKLHRSNSDWISIADDSCTISQSADPTTSAVESCGQDSSGRRCSTSSTSSTVSSNNSSKFGSIRSRIKDYLSAAAAGVGTNRKSTYSSTAGGALIPTSMSSCSIVNNGCTRASETDSSTYEMSFPATVFGSCRNQRESSPATRWRPQTDDYALATNADSKQTTVNDLSANGNVGRPTTDCNEVADSGADVDRWTNIAGPRPYTTPRQSVSHVPLPPSSSVSMESEANKPATSIGDVTSSITSRISTFLTFLGGAGRNSAAVLSTSASAMSCLTNAGMDLSTVETDHGRKTGLDCGLIHTSSETRGSRANVERRKSDENDQSVGVQNHQTPPPLTATLGRSSRGRSSAYATPHQQDMTSYYAGTSIPAGLSTATLGRSRSLSSTGDNGNGAAKRQPIKFIRDSQQALSTFGSVRNDACSAGETGSGNASSPLVDATTPTNTGVRYKAHLDGNPSDVAYRKLLERFLSEPPHSRNNAVNAQSKNSGVAGQSSFSVSKYIHQSSPTSSSAPVSSVENETGFCRKTGTSDQLAGVATTGQNLKSPGLVDQLNAIQTTKDDSRMANADLTSGLAAAAAAARLNGQSQNSSASSVMFQKFESEIDVLVRLLSEAAASGSSAPPPCSIGNPISSVPSSLNGRQTMLALTRRFVADSQRMVSSAAAGSAARAAAGGGDQLLVASVGDSLLTLTEIVDAARWTASVMHAAAATSWDELESQPNINRHHQQQQQQQRQLCPKALILLGRVRDLVETYRVTVQTARMADGRPFDSAEMKALVAQATALATLLGSLIRTLSRASE